MNSTKEMRSKLRAENRNWPVTLKPVSVWLWPNDGNTKRKAVWRSRGFLVQVFEESNGSIRLSVNRTDCDKNGKWIDGITWEELMQVKRECGFGTMLAVEFYPPDEDIVNVANLRHLFIGWWYSLDDSVKLRLVTFENWGNSAPCLNAQARAT